MRYIMIAGAFAAAATLAAPAEAVSIGKIFAVGDSLNDCCRHPDAPFNNGTETWLPAFASAVGGDYTEDETHNYAVGGAQTGPGNAIPITDTVLVGYPTGFTSQAARFKAAAPATGTHDLGVLWIGTNDIWASAYDADMLFGLSFNRPVGKQPSVADFVSQTVATISAGIADLKAGGIEKLLILTPYDMSQAGLWDTPAAQALNRDYSLALRDRLMTLYTPGLETWALDMVAVLQAAQGSFPNTTAATPCPTPTTPGACTDYIFNDFVHFTSAMNAVISAEAAALINDGSPVAPIPLPAPVALLTTGLAGLIVVRRRKVSA